MVEKVKSGLKRFWEDGKRAVFFLGKADGKIIDHWKFRRQLIFGGYRLAVAMIVFGALTFWFDTGVSNTLVVSGTSLISIILTAYVAGATYEDGRVNKRKDIEP